MWVFTEPNGYRPGPRVCFGPAAIAGVAIASSVMAAGVSAYGDAQSAAAQQQAANYNAQVAANNAAIANQNATASLTAGASAQETQAVQTKAQVGGELSAQAASGLDVDSGTAVNVRSSAAELGQMSGMNISYNAARQALGYQATAGSESAQSQLDVMQGEQASTAGMFSSTGAVLGGVSTAGNNYYNDQRTGWV
jgi:hypothetical protein